MLFTVNVFAQDNVHYLGYDISKTVTDNLLNRIGFTIEPVYTFIPDSSYARIKVAGGYNIIHRNKVYNNCDITTQGWYIKPGIGFSRQKKVITYLNVLVSDYSIKNTYTLEGENFGDYKKTYRHNNLYAVGIEPNFDYWIAVHKRISLVVNFQLMYIVYNSKSENFPLFSIPGTGVLINKKISPSMNLSVMFR